MLDGDVLRKGLCKGLGFSKDDRSENVRRISEVANILVSNGVLVFVAVISPYSADRAIARELFPPNKFFEVYLSTDLDTCIARDPKGLYAQAKDGEIRNFTGLNDPYEVPQKPDFKYCNPP